MVFRKPDARLDYAGPDPAIAKIALVLLLTIGAGKWKMEPGIAFIWYFWHAKVLFFNLLIPSDDFVDLIANRLHTYTSSVADWDEMDGLTWQD